MFFKFNPMKYNIPILKRIYPSILKKRPNFYGQTALTSFRRRAHIFL